MTFKLFCALRHRCYRTSSSGSDPLDQKDDGCGFVTPREKLKEKFRLEMESRTKKSKARKEKRKHSKEERRWDRLFDDMGQLVWRSVSMVYVQLCPLPLACVIWLPFLSSYLFTFLSSPSFYLIVVICICMVLQVALLVVLLLLISVLG